MARNVFHRAFVLGPLDRGGTEGVRGRMVVDGRLAAEAPARADHAELVLAAARILVTVGERLQAGDRLITGSVVQVPLAPGNEAVAQLGPLGAVGVRVGQPPALEAT